MSGGPLRVALDVRDARAPDLRGWGRYAACLAAALRRRDDVLLQEDTGGRGLPEVLFEQVIWPARVAGRRPRPALLHAPNCFLPVLRTVPGVVTVHDLAFETHPHDFAPRTGAKYRALTRRAARSAQAVLCPSRATADDVVAHYGVPEARVHVVPLAPALPLGARPAGGAPGVEGPAADPYVLAVGDLRSKKNLERLVRAWRQSGVPHRLVLAGGGDGRALAAAGAEVTGYLPDDELDALLRGASLLVHPSLHEGFGLVLLEAMARGVPVACSATTALPETAGDAAVLFDPTSVPDMARAIAGALADPAPLVAAGHRRAASFTWDRAAEATAAVYHEVAA